MLKKSKRILSLILALVMLCSTLGVMAFAAEKPATAYIECPSTTCKNAWRTYRYRCSEGLNRIIECPLHNGMHDAEEWYYSEYYCCEVCNRIYSPYDPEITYVCLW